MDLADRFPTATGVPLRPRHGPWELWLQRLGLLLLAAVVVIACLGLLGPRTGSAEASGPAGTLEIEHQDITRPGIDTATTLTLTPAEPRDTYVMSIDRLVFEVWGIDRIVPEPATQTTDGDRVVLEFSGTQSGALEVVFEGRTSTTEPPGSTPWTLRWHDAGDGEPLEISGSTKVMP